MHIFFRWFEFEVRHTPGGFEQLACELAGQAPPIYVTSGKVSALTQRGAKRLIRKKWRKTLIEILNVKRAQS